MKLKLSIAAVILVGGIFVFFPWTTSCGIYDPVKVQVEVNTLSKMIVFYHDSKGVLPNSLTDLINEDVIKRLPPDPWGYEYQYAVSENGFVVWSQGAILKGGFSSSSITVRNEEGKFVNSQVQI